MCCTCILFVYILGTTGEWERRCGRFLSFTDGDESGRLLDRGSQSSQNWVRHTDTFFHILIQVYNVSRRMSHLFCLHFMKRAYTQMRIMVLYFINCIKIFSQEINECTYFHLKFIDCVHVYL